MAVDDLRIANAPGLGRLDPKYTIGPDWSGFSTQIKRPPAPAVRLSVNGVNQWKLLASSASRRADAAATLQNPAQETVDLRIADLSAQPGVVHQQAAVLLVEGFDHPKGWPNPESATMEVERVLHEGFAFGALEDALLLGWIGGLPQYDGRVWELHPLVVRPRLRGVGRALVAAFERRGAPARRTDPDARHR